MLRKSKKFGTCANYAASGLLLKGSQIVTI